MKKLFVIMIVCALVLNVKAQSETGFATSGDVMVGYKDKVVNTILSYDFGYRFLPGLYVGAGPMAAGGFGQGKSNFSAGGYGKVRYILPMEFSVKPFVDGRVGYAHSFEEKTGAMFYGAGLGVNLGKRFCVAVYCHMPKTVTISEERYIKGYEKKYNPIDKKTYNVPVYGTREVKNSKLQFIPALLISMQF
ncbi:MAG: hypothetical protein IJE43_24080 [Alphaproteobacteria bacterium]|nr:hypothetical protein [Alphaproteobacteria bacterium]